MPLLTVPATMTPRNVGAAFGAVSLCQASPDGDSGCPPAAWVNVVIKPWGKLVGGVPTQGQLVSPDASGQFLHCLFSFAAPQIDIGKRRATELNNFLTSLPTATGARTELKVETDPGCYWIGSPCQVLFIGGISGDIYDMSIEFSCVKQVRKDCMNVDLMEPPFAFALTSIFLVTDPLGGFDNFPAFPDYHTHFEVVQGAARIALAAGNVPLDASYGPAGKIPLNTLRAATGALAVTTGIYRTSGAF